jgi:hypothetical protein
LTRGGCLFVYFTGYPPVIQGIPGKIDRERNTAAWRILELNIPKKVVIKWEE